MTDTKNLPAVVPVAEIRMMAEAVAKSNLFGVKTTEQAMALMLIAHAEGLHPAIAARDYNIIQGRPAKTSEAMLRSFLQLGGKVEWHELTDERVSATFSHEQGGTAKIDWDMARAKKAGLGGKDNWSKYPRQMLRARVISEGVRTIHPGATSGMYTPEEVRDFEPPKRLPKARADEQEPVEGEVLPPDDDRASGASTAATSNSAAPPLAPEARPSAEERLRECGSLAALQDAWNTLSPEDRKRLAQVKDDCKLAIIEAERVAAQ